MKTLLVLRHAKSSWKKISLADHDRPLNKRGKRDAPKMGRLLRELGLVPDLILTSTAKRARTTARVVAQASGYEGEIHATRDMYHAWTESFLEILRGVEDDPTNVMVVAHNPGLEGLVEELTGVYERMPTAALAQIELPIDTWEELGTETEGVLIETWRPKEIW
jgi:phosphohistidine phosphatase